MSDHFVIVADQGHLRIFQRTQDPEQMRPGLREVQALDFPQGVKSYSDPFADQAGRFQGSKTQGAGVGSPVARQGMSIDERLPMQREMDRRRNGDLGQSIDTFLESHADATWDFAAPAETHRLILDALSPKVRSRLQRVVPKDLVNQPVASLLQHFNGNGKKEE